MSWYLKILNWGNHFTMYTYVMSHTAFKKMLYNLNIHNFYLSIIPQMLGEKKNQSACYLPNKGRHQLDHLQFLIHRVLYSMKKYQACHKTGPYDWKQKEKLTIETDPQVIQRLQPANKVFKTTEWYVEQKMEKMKRCDSIHGFHSKLEQSQQH